MDATPRPRFPIVMFALFVAVCLAPMVLRLQHPSLYSDDVTRVEQLQLSPSLGSLLFIPFNEHMAPAFQTVSWVAWQMCGHELTSSPLAFTVASLVPHVLCLIALGVLVSRELKSTTTAMASVAMLGLSGLIIETYAWYSASSFTWALLGSIVALDAAGRAVSVRSRRSRTAWLMVAAVSSCLAPAGSAIGMLAGPLAALRLVFEPGWSVKAKALSLAPVSGTFAYLGMCALHRFGEVLATSESSRVDVAAAVRNVATVPAAVLVPGQIGLPNLANFVPGVVLMAATGLLVVATLIWAIRSPNRRGLILGSLWMIVVGYALTIGLRSYPGSPMTLINERYQLFPQLGIVILMALILRRPLSRFDANPRASVATGLVISLVVLGLNWRAIGGVSTSYRWNEQGATLAAIERLADIGRSEGITRDQILAAVDPVRKRWFNHEGNALKMLPLTLRESRVPDDRVRSIVLANLTDAEREAIYGGVNVSGYLQPAIVPSDDQTVARGRLVRKFEVQPSTGQDRWNAGGWASFLEFDLGRDGEQAKRIALKVQGPVEVWWSGKDGKWSEGRSVRWWPATTEPTEWVLPLDRLPHWDKATATRVRVTPRRKGVMTAGTPRLLR